ncbi:MAG: gamma-glutamyltransferase [Marinobacter sp.]|uniref:gamma-glutamyltransferase n=1 Tax=Marinobacter sp. TaxID=50741 RepID=UPI00299E2CE5|nr:gamma-glutamyltransferase [Marinobacter sp.]MDX1633085.1 gamma-glutamyltransferase [Marinobacter sp.]
MAERFMVTAANPHAVEAGVGVLRNGGNAMDAAVAVQMALTFVEPPETGIGGGGFLLYRDAASGRITLYDGREVAPAAAKPDRFMLWHWRMPLYLAVPSGLSVGVPGLVAMLHDAHQEHGTRPWAELFEPAIELARDGIAMPDRLQRQIDDDFSLRLLSDTDDYFVRQWREEPPRLQNPELARVLGQVAEQGPDAFYKGDIGESVVEAARGRWLLGSDITMADLREYSPQRREPVCGRYREWTLCGASPPSSGGIAVLQILGMLEQHDLAALTPGSAEAIHLIAEASRLAFADRFQYVGDPAFVDVPSQPLVSEPYLAARGALIDPTRAMAEVHPGEPGGPVFLEDEPVPVEKETTGTSHFNIVDQQGNIVAMTSSIESPFGSRIMVRGFLLNNQLTDFTFKPRYDGERVANAVAPGKRPRSSMSPLIVMDADGEVQLILGSRGGSRIIGYVVKALVGVLDWNMTVQQAISQPNFLHRGKGYSLELEAGTPAAEQAGRLRAMGHEVDVITLESGLHGIQRTRAGWQGGADPRMDGIALGD